MNKPNIITYGSYLSYTPKPLSEEAAKAFDIRLKIKNFEMINQHHSFIDYYVEHMAKRLNQLPFRGFFDPDAVLVPIPRSNVMREGDLWVAKEICKSLERNRLGKTYKLLLRGKSLRASSRSSPEERPTPFEHYQSLDLVTKLTAVQRVVLVDDFITRGHTALGSAWRILDGYPDAEIVVFALVRTVSNPAEFRSLIDPREGTIEYRPDIGDALRRP